MTRSDIEKLIDYLNDKLPKYFFNDTIRIGEVTSQGGNEGIYGRIDDLENLIRDYPVESDKTCGPNYEAMYNACVVENRELKNRLENYCLERAHYVGAVNAFELIFGHRLAFHECGVKE